MGGALDREGNDLVAHAIEGIMAESTRRQLKVDVPPEIKVRLKHEAVEIDIPLTQYFRRILDYRLPWHVMDKIDARAKLEGLDGPAYLLKLLKQAGVLDK